MICSICHGTGGGTKRADGLCEQCLGTGYYQADADYVRLYHERVAKRAAIRSLLRSTHGKNGLGELPAIKLQP